MVLVKYWFGIGVILKVATVVLVKILVWHWCHSLAPKILLEASGLSPAGARTMSRCATWDLHHNLFLL